MTLSSREAVATIEKHRGDALVVTTMTAMKWLDELSTGTQNLSCVPMMGGASGLGLGLALARPDLKVLVLDGDGSLLMQLGTLATIAGAGPRNLIHFVFDNGVWFEGAANVALPKRVDFATMANAAGYVGAVQYADTAAFEDAVPAILEKTGPYLVQLEIEPEPPSWGRESSQPFLPDRQFSRMGAEARAIRAALMAE